MTPATIPASLRQAINGARKRRSAPFTIPEHKLVLSQLDDDDDPFGAYPWGLTHGRD